MGVGLISAIPSLTAIIVLTSIAVASAVVWTDKIPGNVEKFFQRDPQSMVGLKTGPVYDILMDGSYELAGYAHIDGNPKGVGIQRCLVLCAVMVTHEGVSVASRAFTPTISIYTEENGTQLFAILDQGTVHSHPSLEAWLSIRDKISLQPGTFHDNMENLAPLELKQSNLESDIFRQITEGLENVGCLTLRKFSIYEAWKEVDKSTVYNPVYVCLYKVNLPAGSDLKLDRYISLYIDSKFQITEKFNPKYITELPPPAPQAKVVFEKYLKSVVQVVMESVTTPRESVRWQRECPMGDDGAKANVKLEVTNQLRLQPVNLPTKKMSLAHMQYWRLYVENKPSSHFGIVYKLWDNALFGTKLKADTITTDILKNVSKRTVDFPVPLIESSSSTPAAMTSSIESTNTDMGSFSNSTLDTHRTNLRGSDSTSLSWFSQLRSSSGLSSGEKQERLKLLEQSMVLTAPTVEESESAKSGPEILKQNSDTTTQVLYCHVVLDMTTEKNPIIISVGSLTPKLEEVYFSLEKFFIENLVWEAPSEVSSNEYVKLIHAVNPCENLQHVVAKNALWRQLMKDIVDPQKSQGVNKTLAEKEVLKVIHLLDNPEALALATLATDFEKVKKAAEAEAAKKDSEANAALLAGTADKEQKNADAIIFRAAAEPENINSRIQAAKDLLSKYYTAESTLGTIKAKLNLQFVKYSTSIPDAIARNTVHLRHFFLLNFETGAENLFAIAYATTNNNGIVKLEQEMSPFCQSPNYFYKILKRTTAVTLAIAYPSYWSRRRIQESAAITAFYSSCDDPIKKIVIPVFMKNNLKLVGFADTIAVKAVGFAFRYETGIEEIASIIFTFDWSGDKTSFFYGVLTNNGSRKFRIGHSLYDKADDAIDVLEAYHDV